MAERRACRYCPNALEQLGCAIHSESAQHGGARRQRFIPSRRRLVIAEQIEIQTCETPATTALKTILRS